MKFIPLELPKVKLGDSEFLACVEDCKLIKSRREELGFTQQQIADIAGIKLRHYQRVESGENHIIKAGENKYNILTKQTIEEKKVNIQCLRNTSIFYTLYQDGLITSKEIKLDKNVLAKYIKQWDGQNQYEVPELIADKEARDYIRDK